MSEMRGPRSRLWESDSQGPGYRTLSALLAPAEWLFRLGVGARAWGYDRGLIRSQRSPIPALVVGNLTVGGTGKTPLTAWFAGRLAELGARPAIVLRGYGGDEDKVHSLLNPSLPVVVSPDRVAGVGQARGNGADVVVLDDAFQHRAIRASASVVLIAVEEWADVPRLLPRGPWREPLSALRRASLLVTTRKDAPVARATQVGERLAELHPSLPRAAVHLALAGLASYELPAGVLSEVQPLAGFHCALALAGVARPSAFAAQLKAAGVAFDEFRAYPDHHRYSSGDLAEIGRYAEEGPVVATLKDAVKLGPALPRAVSIHVPIQRVVWEQGRDEVSTLLGNLLRERKK